MLIKAKLIQVAGQEPGFGESEGSDWYQIGPKLTHVTPLII